MFTGKSSSKKNWFCAAVLLFMATTKTATAQSLVLYVAPGETMYVAATDTLHTFGLGLTPNTTLDLSGISINRNVTLASTPLNPVVSRAFTFTPVAPDFRGFYKFWYETNELNSIPEDQLKLYYYASFWNIAPTANHDLEENVMTSNTVTILPTELTLAPLFAALPLTWLEINARLNNKQVTVSWETADESDLEGYTVMHSLNGQNWNSIGTAKPQLGTKNSYTFLHTNPATGKNYYRIMASELNGDTKLSKVVTAMLVANNTLSVYPNPVNSQQNGSLQLGKAAVIQIWRSNGTLVSEAAYPAGTHNISTKGLLPGVYFISNGEKVIKWIIQ